MFGDQETIISSGTGPSGLGGDSGEDSKLKKIFLIGGIVLVVLVLSVGIFFLAKNFLFKKPQAKPVVENEASTSPIIFPNLNLPSSATSTDATSTFNGIAIEYLSFADFYQAPNNNIETKFQDYELPLNVKIDVLNYYDVSRKLNLDPALTSLNDNGFATIVNPWPKEAPDFYSIYSNLDKNQIPLLITSDAMIYYQQTILKKVYKDIEASIFYDNLWAINKELYTAAKNRYEARLAAIGNINDSILEGERLEAAFFAVALELLKPTPEQIAPKGTLEDKKKFVETETERFNFTTPVYLRDDVLREVKLVRESKLKTKSPVMLYNRDYRDFSVPADYRTNARLNNFYLATKWLNSVFPLNSRADDCPDCLLDKEDWRLSMIAASFISSDFSNLPELKNKWARIYKVMSYFNPLRDDLNYVHYRDALKSNFGENYNIEEIFDDKNYEARDNLQKMQAKLNAIEFSPFSGAIDKVSTTTNFRIGFKMLAENYSPNDYIFSGLSYPNVGDYLGTSTPPNNVTACAVRRINRRCSNFALDVINLIQPVSDHPYFQENTNYLDYEQASQSLRDKLDKDNIWRFNNYWSNLAALSSYLNMDKNSLPVFSRSLAWRDQNLNTAVGSWINSQLPMGKFSINQIFRGRAFNNFSEFNDSSYVEPNLNLVNELLANNNMVQKMLTTLQINRDVGSVNNDLQMLNDNFTALKAIVIKELSGEKLSSEDNEIISNFAKQLTLETSPISQRQILLKSGFKNGPKEDLNRLKLMVLIHQDGDSKIISVGPVWDYVESRY